jgi:predicted nucleic acid-binding protein
LKIDYDDNKFVDAAIVRNVDFIVTNDRHFNPLKEIDFPKVEIINIDDFLDIVKKLI